MKDDNARDLRIEIAWTLWRLKKLIAVDGDAKQTFWFTKDSDGKNTPQPEDQALALRHLEVNGALTIGRPRCKNDLNDKVVQTGLLNIKPDGFDIEIERREVQKLAEDEEYQTLIERLNRSTYPELSHLTEMPINDLVFVDDPKKRSAFLCWGDNVPIEVKRNSQQYPLIKVLQDLGSSEIGVGEVLTYSEKYKVSRRFKDEESVKQAFYHLLRKAKLENNLNFPIQLAGSTFYIKQKIRW